ncbi:hypothetical protein P153DRAFT_221313 [Dothidotthia symphoricarpi CBS 119687]|uniref:Uncharacterized protein n=1 Tax=Dothidotthia symphoricarpi CBS 119687 TaxID=1392245 RepID=A0A6A6AFA8_9PLEO|nr:uncharacterized protein P153DRAFT_221313 [Dothidotthia symphoricarpi CBS 119687]KAF2130589.1 hypothetical protein P153DRAFT_221313 [Dothidotthia symphoricarpi CBS 119687]
MFVQNLSSPQRCPSLPAHPIPSNPLAKNIKNEKAIMHVFRLALPRPVPSRTITPSHPPSASQNRQSTFSMGPCVLASKKQTFAVHDLASSTPKVPTQNLHVASILAHADLKFRNCVAVQTLRLKIHVKKNDVCPTFLFPNIRTMC